MQFSNHMRSEAMQKYPNTNNHRASFTRLELLWSRYIKLATVVEGDQKITFSIANTLRFGEGAISFPGLPHFTLDTYLILLSVKLGGIKYHFLKSLVWRDLGLSPDLPDHWQTLYPLGQWILQNLWLNRVFTHFVQ